MSIGARAAQKGCKKSLSPKKCQLEIDPKRKSCYFWPLFDFFLFRRQYAGCDHICSNYSCSSFFKRFFARPICCLTHLIFRPQKRDKLVAER